MIVRTASVRATCGMNVDVGQTTNEKERSNARLERLRRRGAARRARLEAQVEAAAEPENPGVIVY